MSLRKFSAESLFDGHQFIEDAVLVTDREGIIQEIVRTSEAGESIEHLKGMLVPGFINTHCHLELSHLKGIISPGCGFTPFLGQVVNLRAAAPDTILEAIDSADSTMLKEGIVAVGDICNTTDTIKRKSRSRIYYHSFIETIGFNNNYAESIYEQSKVLRDIFSSHLPTESISITPHAPYSVSDALYSLISGNERLLSIHNQEDDAENQFFLEGKGPLRELLEELNINVNNFKHPQSRSVQAIWKHFHKNQQVILVHNVATSRNDIDFISRKPDNPKIYWCLCTNANLYITGKLPDIGLLQRNGKIVLGTDSLASNHQLSILDEMKTIQKNYSVSLQQLLQWATINGADALNINNRFGSFEKGKQPGVVLIREVAGEDLSKAVVERIV